LLNHVDAVRHQAAGGDEVPESIYRRQTVSRRERDDEIAIVIGRTVWWQEETTVRRTRKGRNTLFDGVSIILDGRRCDFDAERGRDRLRRAHEIVVSEPLWIADLRCSCQRRRNL